MNNNKFQILSLDGGGLKGIFTVALLAHLEKQKKTRIIEHFDLITGTSTGGIIALGLGMGFSANDILQFYLEKGEYIFPINFLGKQKQLLKTKYSDKNLNNALKDIFKNRRLGNSLKRLLIPAYNSQRGEVYIFKTAHHPRLENDYLELARDVARATSGAPTFFDPFVKESGLRIIDGGIWANNPVMIAITEGMGCYLQYPQRNISVLSIGTTIAPVATNAAPKTGGVVQWAFPLIEFFMRGQDEAANNMAYHLLGKRFYRINPVVSPNEFRMDVLSSELVALADAEYRKHSPEISSGFLTHQSPKFNPFHKIDNE